MYLAPRGKPANALVRASKEPTWHRRARRKRSIAKHLLWAHNKGIINLGNCKVSHLSSVLYKHHSWNNSINPRLVSAMTRWKCASCGYMMPPSAEYCSHCGQHWEQNPWDSWQQKPPSSKRSKSKGTSKGKGNAKDDPRTPRDAAKNSKPGAAPGSPEFPVPHQQIHSKGKEYTETTKPKPVYASPSKNEALLLNRDVSTSSLGSWEDMASEAKAQSEKALQPVMPPCGRSSHDIAELVEAARQMREICQRTGENVPSSVSKLLQEESSTPCRNPQSGQAPSKGTKEQVQSCVDNRITAGSLVEFPESHERKIR